MPQGRLKDTFSERRSHRTYQTLLAPSPASLDLIRLACESPSSPLIRGLVSLGSAGVVIVPCRFLPPAPRRRSASHATAAGARPKPAGPRRMKVCGPAGSLSPRPECPLLNVLRAARSPGRWRGQRGPTDFRAAGGFGGKCRPRRWRRQSRSRGEKGRAEQAVVAREVDVVMRRSWVLLKVLDHWDLEARRPFGRDPFQG